MSRRFLDVLGLLSLLAIFAASVTALVAVKGRFTVTIAETRRESAPDPVALLRDDVAGLRRDLQALVDAVRKEVESRAPAADDDTARAKALAAALAPIETALGRLAERLDAAGARADAAQRETAAAVADLRARVDGVVAAVRASAAAPTAPNSPPSLAGAQPVPAGPAAAGALPPPARAGAPAPSTAGAAPSPSTVPALSPSNGEGPAPAAGTPAAGPPTPAGKRRGFLSFSLPSEAFEPGQLTRFEVIPSLSKVGFDAKSTLHDFSGATSELSGSIVARLARPAEGTTATIEAQAATLDTGILERNAELATTLDAKAFPTVSFTLESYVPTGADASGKSGGTATGRLTIHGVERRITSPVRVSLDEGKRLVVEGESAIRLTDFGVKPPRKFGIVAVEDEVKVWWSVRARAVGRAE